MKKLLLIPAIVAASWLSAPAAIANTPSQAQAAQSPFGGPPPAGALGLGAAAAPFGLIVAGTVLETLFGSNTDGPAAPGTGTGGWAPPGSF